MKKILFLLVVLSAMSVNTLADGLTATLQQGDNMQVFYGTDAFKQAYEAAESDDAIIILSLGTFNSVLSIEKSMTVVGCGAFSSSKTIISGTMKIMADNVKIEGLYFSSSISVGAISNCHIKRCYLNTTLNASDTHINTFIDQSVVKSDYAVGTGVNYTIKNSTLESFYTMNTEDNKANITNCVIYYWAKYDDSTRKQPHAIYVSNILGGYRKSYDYNFTCSTLSEYYYNYFLQTYCCSFIPSFPDGCKYDGNEYGTSFSSTYFPALNSNNYGKLGVGIDGTEKGIYGGSGFKKESSIPKIISKTIPTNADEQGKINVTISATTGPN